MHFILLYVIVAALSPVFLNVLGHTIPIPLLALVTTGLAVLFFNVINYKKLGLMYRLFLNHKILFLQINVAVVITWLGSFLSTTIFGGSISLFTFMTVMAIWGAWFNQKTSTAKLTNLLKFLLLLVTLIVYYVLLSRHNINYFWVMIVLTIVTGSGGFYYLKLSARANQIGLNSTQVLATRFWVQFIILAVYCFWVKDTLVWRPEFVWQVSLATVLSLIVPLYLMLKSVEKIGPAHTALWSALTPFACFIFEFLIQHQPFDYETPCLFTSALIIIGFYFAEKK